MALILTIDTAFDRAVVTLGSASPHINTIAKEHSAWLHPAIQDIIREAGVTINEIDAIAVNGGPGSYTGLRVGMSAAKGLAFALDKPLIVVGSLELMAQQAIRELPPGNNHMICPMIDARREEVYTALYSPTGDLLLKPTAMILDDSFINSRFAGHQIFYFGNGADKLRKIQQIPASSIFALTINDLILPEMCNLKYAESQFVSVFDVQPIYVKDIYTTSITTQTP